MHRAGNASLTLIWNRTHEGCTGRDTSAVWVSAPPTVDGASVKSICFWPWLADCREPMEWDLIWCQTEYLDEAVYMDWACVCVLDPVLQLMVFMCILVRACAKSQVWVTVAGQNVKTGQWAGFAQWKKNLLILWLIKRTAVMWPHIHMPYQHFTQSC